MPPQRATYTIKELQELLGLSRSAIYLAIKSGQIESIKIGGRVLIPKAPIDKMLGIDAPNTKVPK